MKLEDSLIEKLLHIVGTAKQIGINSLIIDKESIRGQSETGSVLLIENDTLISSTFDSMGISRIDTLFSRLNLIKNNLSSINVDIKQKDNGDKIVLRLTMKNNKTNVEFKCADPQIIKAKKALNSPLVYSFNIDAETINLMVKAKSAMGNPTISFCLNDGKVLFKLSDVEGDTLHHEITSSIKILDDSDSFFFNFNDKTLLPLLKLALNNSNEIQLQFTKRGVMNLTINNINVYIAPER